MNLSYYLRKKVSYATLSNMIKRMIYDIESNCHLYNCYAYPKTIRSILTGSSLSSIAYHFSDKDYFGVFIDSIYLQELMNFMDRLCKEGVITYTISKGKKLYKSIEHIVDTTLSDEDILEIDSLITMDENNHDE